VLPEPERAEFTLIMGDVRIDCYVGSGSGGQHRNKTASCVRATHEPTGTVARSESERSQHVNRGLALSALAAKLAQRRSQEASAGLKSQRRQQVGSGMRGDKVRTVRTQDGVVTDHRAGRKTRLKEYLRGDLSWLV
jgi:peptide chain release factor 1